MGPCLLPPLSPSYLLDPFQVGVAFSMVELAGDLRVPRRRNDGPGVFVVDSLVDGALVVGSVSDDLGNGAVDLIEEAGSGGGITRARVRQVGGLNLAVGIDRDMQLFPASSAAPTPPRRGPFPFSEDGQPRGIGCKLERAAERGRVEGDVQAASATGDRGVVRNVELEVQELEQGGEKSLGLAQGEVNSSRRESANSITPSEYFFWPPRRPSDNGFHVFTTLGDNPIVISPRRRRARL